MAPRVTVVQYSSTRSLTAVGLWGGKQRLKVNGNELKCTKTTERDQQHDGRRTKTNESERRRTKTNHRLHTRSHMPTSF